MRGKKGGKEVDKRCMEKPFMVEGKKTDEFFSE